MSEPTLRWSQVVLPPGQDLVAVTSDLDPARVRDAYRHGIFPWFDAGMPVLWWSPEPRTILPLDERFHVPRRLARTLRTTRVDIRVDTAFGAVMRACAERRPDGCWIHAEMIDCYEALHADGHAHSLEVWRGGRLVGGLYGVAFGAGFAAESMFHRERDMSKIALVHLVDRLRARGFELLDVQFTTGHLRQFGTLELPRAEYLRRVRAVRDADVTW